MEIADQIRQWLLAAPAVVGGIFAWRAFLRERRRDELRDTERRQEQAREVAAWLGEAKVSAQAAPGFARIAAQMQGEWVVAEVLVSNQSSTPVYDVRAWVRHRSSEEPPLELHLVQALPKQETPIHLSEEQEHQLLVLVESRPDNDTGAYRRYETRRPVTDFLVALQFRDAGGQRWERTALGVLSPIEEPVA